MELPSSDKLKRPLQISLIFLLIIIVVYVFLYLFVSNQLGEPMDEEMNQKVFQQSENLIYDIFEESNKDTYETYVSLPVKAEDKNGVWWGNTVDNIRQNELILILPYERQEEFYKAKRMSDDSSNIIRYGVDLLLELNIDGNKKETIAKVEWIEEEENLRLYLLEMPYKFIPIAGPVNAVYGIND